MKRLERMLQKKKERERERERTIFMNVRSISNREYLFDRLDRHQNEHHRKELVEEHFDLLLIEIERERERERERRMIYLATNPLTLTPNLTTP
jgi:hypothetical protein